MKKIIFSMFVIWFCCGGGFADPLAADEMAARYRTGEVDERVLSVPQELEASVFESPEENLPSLVAFLIKDTEDQFLIVKRLHDWITFHIAYDSDLFLGTGSGGSRNPLGFLPLKRTTCGGFTALFTAMASFAGLETVGVRGRSRNYITSSGPSGHAWNIVKIGEKWYIVDVTADNRMGYYLGKFSEKRKYSDYSLFIHPDMKILINYPDNEAYKFSDRFATLQEFLDAPQINIHGLKYGVEIEGDFFSQIKKESYMLKGGVQSLLRDAIEVSGETLKIHCRVPGNVRLSGSLRDLDISRFDEFSDDNEAFEVKSYQNNIHVRLVDKGYYEIAISPPGKGRYQVHLNARFTDAPGNAQAFYSFILSSLGKKGELLPAKNVVSRFHYFYEHGVELLEDNWDVASRDGYYFFKLKLPDGVEVVSNLRDFENNIHKEYYFKSENGNIHEFYYKIPDTGDFIIRVFTKKVGDSRFENCFDLRIDCSGRKAEVFPPSNKLYYRKFFAIHGFAVVESNVDVVKDVYYVKMRCPAGYKMSAGIYDLEGNRFSENFIMDIDGDFYSFYFTQPSVGIAAARIFMIDGEKKYYTVSEFYLNNGVAGQLLPEGGKIYRNRVFADNGMRLLAENVSTDDGADYYVVKIDKGSAAALHAGVFDENDKRIDNSFSYSVEGNVYTFYFSGVEKTWSARIYAVDSDGRMNTAAVFKVAGDSAKQAVVPPAGLIFLNYRFFIDGFALVDEIDLSMEYAEIVVRVPPGLGLRASLRDGAGTSHGRDLEVSNVGDLYKVRFKTAPGLTLRLFKATSDNKTYLVGLLRL
ncbi:MAG: hypothetical protein JXR63_05685 [Spirochaetales bacterium]|nr:hypothetical protein [Spirochaetales bacterium]